MLVKTRFALFCIFCLVAVVAFVVLIPFLVIALPLFLIGLLVLL